MALHLEDLLTCDAAMRHAGDRSQGGRRKLAVGYNNAAKLVELK